MATQVERVVAVGGSTTLGIGADGNGWVQMLHSRYRELNADLGIARRPRIFYELGVFAAKAHHIANNVAADIDKRFWIPSEEGDPDATKRLAIVSTGVNDSTVLPTGMNLTPLNEFRASVGMIAATLAEKCRVMYVGTFPCDEEKSAAFWDFEGVPRQYEARLEYEKAAMEIFSAVGAVAIPMAAAAYESEVYMSDIVADGMHAGPQGERWVYERVVPHFDAMVGIDQTTVNS